MPDLPDLNTSNISFIAFWNAIDDGEVGAIDPSDVLSDSNILEYTLYDNGVHIDRLQGPYREFEARVKTDGWVMVYLDDSADFSTGDDSYAAAPNGWWDLAYNWKQIENAPADFSDTALHRLLKNLATQFSNWNNMKWLSSDVGLHNFQYPDAVGTTGMSTYDRDSDDWGGLSYTSDTTIHEAVMLVADSYQDHQYSTRAWVENTDISSTVNVVDGHNYAAVDLIAENLITESGVSYALSADPNATVSAIVIWS